MEKSEYQRAPESQPPSPLRIKRERTSRSLSVPPLFHDTGNDMGALPSTLHPVLQRTTRVDVAAAVVFVALLGLLVRSKRSPRVRTTRLRGPKAKNPIFGFFGVLVASQRPGELVEEWVEENGPVFTIPMVGFVQEVILLADVQAMMHCMAEDTWLFNGTALAKYFISNLVSDSVCWNNTDS